MTKTTKIVRTIYLYAVALISLGFLAAGVGNFINTGLKSIFFQAAEKQDYYSCNNQPYFSTVDAQALKDTPGATADQKTQLDNLLKDYATWKAQNTGDACIVAQRQKKLVDASTMIIIALPLYLIHWRLARKEKQEVEA